MLFLTSLQDANATWEHSKPEFSRTLPSLPPSPLSPLGVRISMMPFPLQSASTPKLLYIATCKSCWRILSIMQAPNIVNESINWDFISICLVDVQVPSKDSRPISVPGLLVELYWRLEEKEPVSVVGNIQRNSAEWRWYRLLTTTFFCC
jgi:hypothetical protein